MEPASAPSARSRRQRGAWPFAPVALATLVALGCGGPITPIGPPEFLGTVTGQTYTVNEEIRPLVLPAATGGSGTLTYSLGPEIPPGLEFAAGTRTLSGTPTDTGTYPMTYTVRDERNKTDELEFEITVETFAFIRSIVAAIDVEGTAGVPRFEDVPEPSGGPAVTVTGNHVYVAGGSVFLNIEPEPGATVDKLLLSIRGKSFGYYEVDLPDGAASHRLVGRVQFDLDPPPPGCLDVSAVDASGAVGPPECHGVIGIPVDFSEVQVTVSWDTDADLDLHVADPTGAEVYFGRRRINSGGVLDLTSNDGCEPDGPVSLRNEHIAWSNGSPPAGIYEVRVNHWSSCGAPETNYVVSVYNHGHTTTFHGTFTGRGDRLAGRGIGTVITLFQVGDDPPPPRAKTLSSTYRGSGDQVFVLNPNGEVLDDTLFSLNLGTASAEVYVIATAGHYHVESRVERLDLREAAAKGLRAAVQDEHEPQPRPPAYEVAPERAWVAEFNNNPPLSGSSYTPPKRLQAQSERTVAEGDTFNFLDLDDDGELIEIPATARKVVTDGSTTVAVWVADSEWGPACQIAEQCLDQELVDATADSFLRPGSGNDIYDWVTAIFGVPWGVHDEPLLIDPSADDEIHILLFDIEGDGIPERGESRVVGLFSALNNYRRLPDHPVLGELLRASNERLMLFIDSPFMVLDPVETIGTLAHEYQHMIHFYQKLVLRDARSERWLNEMSSEVAQDLIAYRLMTDGPRGIDYDDPTAGEPRSRSYRLSLYNVYNDFQVISWNQYLANYSINYALGAYLARNYGGRRAVQPHRAERSVRHRSDRRGGERSGPRCFVPGTAGELGGCQPAVRQHGGSGPVPLQ